MKESSTSINDLKSMTNVASPHAKIDDKVTAIPYRNIDNIAPAGSINSNVTEMAEWLRLQLSDGSVGGKRLLSSGAIKEMHMPQTLIRAEFPWTLMSQEAHFIAYGLGWFLHDYRGRKIVHHGGNIDGMSAQVALIPEEKMGIVLLTNMNGTFMPIALQYRVFDAFMNQPQKDWSADLLKGMKALEGQAKDAEKKQIEARAKDTKPSLALEKYVGTYEDPMYGEAKVSLENGKLVAKYGAAFTGDLEHWHYDTFQTKWRDISITGKMMIGFVLGTNGQVTEMKIEGLADFRRVPEKASAAAGVKVSEADLAKFAGKYALEAPPLEVSIELVGDKLKAMVPGQPTYTLIPVSPVRFQIEGAPPGFFVQFEQTGSAVTSLKIEQGQGPTMTFKRK